MIYHAAEKLISFVTTFHLSNAVEVRQVHKGKILEIAKTHQIVNPGFGFESRAKPGFRVWVSGLETHTIFRFLPQQVIKSH